MPTGPKAFLSRRGCLGRPFWFSPDSAGLGLLHDAWGAFFLGECLWVWLGLVLWHIKHCRLFNDKSNLWIWTVLFQTIQFSISIRFSSIWPINRTLSSATTPGLSGTGSNGNKGVLRIPQSSGITGAYSSDYLVLHSGHSLWESYPSAEMQSVYSASPADWTKCWRDQMPTGPNANVAQGIFGVGTSVWATALCQTSTLKRLCASLWHGEMSYKYRLQP